MEEPPSYHTILVLNRSDVSFDPSRLEHAVRNCVDFADAGPSNVTVLVTSNSEVRGLNRQFRSVDEETDVLTFPDGEGTSGDIAIAAHYAQQQASIRGISLEDELALLAIHATLHLLGMEDETDAGRSEMIRRMYDVAETLGIQREEDWGSLLHESAIV